MFATKENQGTGYTEVFAWGSDSSGQMGLASKKTGKNYPIPRFCSFNVIINSISCGEEHSAFIASNGYIYTMGSNADGRLGISSRNVKFSSSPCLVEVLSRYKALKVSCGWGHTAAVVETGEIFTWGNGGDGQLGLGSTNNHHSPQLVSFIQIQSNKPIKVYSTDVECGSQHTAVITEQGELYVFGSSECGQLGTGRMDKELLPYKVDLYSKIAAIACGSQHTIILSEHQKVYASGNNSHGQLGVGNKKASTVFQKVLFSSDQRIKKIAAGSHSAALSESGEVYLWGTGSFGEFLQPQKINGFKNPVADISIGGGYGTAVDIAGILYSWGNNKFGELGLGDYETRFTPTQVTSLNGKRVTQIACGSNYSIALGITIVHKDVEHQRARSVIERSARTNERVLEPVERESHNPFASIDRESTKEDLRDRDFLNRREESFRREEAIRRDKSAEFSHHVPRFSQREENPSFHQQRPSFRNEVATRDVEAGHIKRKVGPAGQFGGYLGDVADEQLSFQRKYFSEKTFEQGASPISRQQEGSMIHINDEDDVGFLEVKPPRSNSRTPKTGSKFMSRAEYLQEDMRPSSKRRDSSLLEDYANEYRKMANYKTVDHSSYKGGEQARKFSSFTDRTEDGQIKEKGTLRNELQALENERLMRENVQMESEIEKLRSKLSEMEGKYGFDGNQSGHVKPSRRGEGSLNELEAKLRNLEHELQTEKESNENFRQVLEEERSQNKKFLRALEENHEIIRSLEEEKRNIQVKRNPNFTEAAEGERDYYRKRYEELQKKIERNEEEFKKAIKDKNDLISKLQEEQSVAGTAIEELNEALKQLSRNQDKDKHLLAQFEKQRESDMKLIEAMKNDMDDQRRKMERQDKTREELKNVYEEKFKNYNSLMMQKEEEIAKLELQVSKKNNEIEELKCQVLKLENQLKDKKFQIDDLVSTLEKMAPKADIRSYKVNLDDYQTRLMDSRKVIEEMDNNRFSPYNSNEELVSILRKDMKNQRQPFKKLKTVAFDIENGRAETPNANESEKFQNSLSHQKYRSSPLPYERKTDALSKQDFSISNSYISTPDRERRARPKSIHARVYDSGNKDNAEDNVASGNSIQYHDLKTELSNTGSSILSENLQKDSRMGMINESAARLMEMLTNDLRKQRNLLESGEKRKLDPTPQKENQGSTQKVQTTPSKELSSSVPNSQSQRVLGEISVPQNNYSSSRDIFKNDEENFKLNTIQLKFDENNNQVNSIPLAFTFQKNILRDEKEEANIDSLKVKLQDLQKNKLALEQRMQEFESRLKESKRKV